ncbi:hypothetical protein [Anaerobacillus arseniciselenatis]|nr:hypothetical protein [Anaerobacillus arseniciselenatis]
MIINVNQRLAEILCDIIEKTTEVDYVRYGASGGMLYQPKLPKDSE